MWADAIPNLIIGLREGLEAGLVVSILLAAVRKSEVRSSTGPIWLGVLAAVTVSLSFGVVLTFYRAGLSTQAQEAFGGVLSVIAVALVTGMVFWMRGAARGIAGELREKVTGALKVGAGALAVIAFLAVGREGLETSLFIWTAIDASGQTTAPVIGAAVGIVVAVGLCWLLFRGAIKLNLGVFFTRTAILLIVIAAGILTYGLGELQAARLLPGHTWVAFDLSSTLDADQWWMAIITGVTNLTPTMTWLQVGGYATYLGTVLFLFLRAARQPAAAPSTRREPTEAKAESTPEVPVPTPPSRRPIPRWAPVTAAIVVPVLAASGFAVLAPKAAGVKQTVQITDDSCAPDWKPKRTGKQTFTITNESDDSGEIYLIHPNDQSIVGEVEAIGPGTRRNMTVTLSAGDYAWRCVMAGQPVRRSATAHIAGTTTAGAPKAVLPVSEKDLQGPVEQYRGYVAEKLTVLTGEVQALNAAIGSGNRDSARAAWLPALRTWGQIGAAYGSFAELGDAIGGLPHGLPKGVDDPDFTGLRRIEYGLWHDQDLAQLKPIGERLQADVAEVARKLPELTVDPADLVLRAHEIGEDALRDHLSGMSDQGGGATYAETLANLQGTWVVVDQLAPLIEPRRPDLLPTVRVRLDALGQLLRGLERDGRWPSLSQTSLADRQRVTGALGDLLENLAVIPNLLEIRTN